MEIKQMMETLNKIKENLRQHFGSETMYTGMVKNSAYSEGVKNLMEQASCYWIYDIIQTECREALRLHDVADTYYFKIVSKDNEANLTLTSYRGKVLFDRHIGFTTFPEGEMNLIVGYGDYGPVVNGVGIITCLPSEN